MEIVLYLDLKLGLKTTGKGMDTNKTALSLYPHQIYVTNLFRPAINLYCWYSKINKLKAVNLKQINKSWLMNKIHI